MVHPGFMFLLCQAWQLSLPLQTSKLPRSESKSETGALFATHRSFRICQRTRQVMANLPSRSEFVRRDISKQRVERLKNTAVMKGQTALDRTNLRRLFINSINILNPSICKSMGFSAKKKCDWDSDSWSALNYMRRSLVIVTATWKGHLVENVRIMMLERDL